MQKTVSLHEPPVKLRRADSIPAQIAAHPAAVPNWLAIADGSSQLTYEELERRSKQSAGAGR